MYQAITTKSIPATNTKPARIKAKCCGGSITISRHVCDNYEEAEKIAVRKLMEKLGFDPTLDFVSGIIDSGDTVHVFLPKN